ncbi:MAG: ATP-binding domain-containing protein [Paramuribaculum sp.]|nr:ATP-binding domain-containing protein [Paramuribaculum sp.]
MVSHIYSTETKYGLRFADVRITLPDREMDVDCKIMLDSLISDTPALAPDKAAMLYQSVLTDPEIFTYDVPMQVRVKILKHDPYFNALQVKYAYAVTCHKAQGGQWHSVFVDMGYIAPEARGLDFYRWLYTAVTRATNTLYFANPDLKIL